MSYQVFLSIDVLGRILYCKLIYRNCPIFGKHHLVVKEYGFYNNRVPDGEHITSGSTTNFRSNYGNNRNKYQSSAMD